MALHRNCSLIVRCTRRWPTTATGVRTDTGVVSCRCSPGGVVSPATKGSSPRWVCHGWGRRVNNWTIPTTAWRE